MTSTKKQVGIITGVVALIGVVAYVSTRPTLAEELYDSTSGAVYYLEVCAKTLEKPICEEAVTLAKKAKIKRREFLALSKEEQMDQLNDLGDIKTSILADKNTQLNKYIHQIGKSLGRE
ncbi:hypothetical protein KAR91_19785 [Candidatus Pacearchaeota archaeon]|nr:hypothetical protein [Candidatus Pacearchaeota archaeon]